MAVDFTYKSSALSLSAQRIPFNNMAKCHKHNEYELYFLAEGERYLFAGDRFYTARAGDAFLIPPGVEHRTLDSGGGEYFRIAINIPAPSMPCGLSIDDGVYFVRPSARAMSRLYSEAEEIYAASRLVGAEQSALIFGAVMKMLAALLGEPRQYEEVTVASPTLGRIAQILKYMEENYSKPITLSLLSERFFISEFYLCRLFKEYTGRTILEYLTDLRIRAARKMLRDSDAQIGTIAKKCGFGSSSSFGSAFRRAEGVSAREYKRRGTK